MKTSKKIIVLLFCIFVSILGVTNYLFYSKLNDLKNSSSKVDPGLNNSIADNIIFYSKNFHYTYFAHKATSENNTEIFIHNIKKYNELKNVTSLWNLANSWISNKHIVNYKHKEIGNIFRTLKYAPIIKADLDNRGSQLKFLFTLQVRMIDMQ